MTSGGFGFVAGNLTKLLEAPRYGFGALRASLTRRDPGLWVVGSAFGPVDGALAFCRAAANLPDPPRVVWLSGSATETQAGEAVGLEVVGRDSRDGRKLTLRAGLVALTHGFADAYRFGLTGAVIVQLWHGSPLKKLHADSPAVMDLGGLGRIPGLARLVRFAYRRGTRRISLLPTCSMVFVPFLSSAFDLHDGQVQVLGEPRADVLFVGSQADRIAAARARLAPYLGPHKDARVVLFATTWRDGNPDPVVPTATEWARIEAVCQELDLVLLVRPHPLAVGDYLYQSARVRHFPAREQPEVIPVLWGVDALISDYSSILIDFVATGRPVLLLAPDLESYRDSRGLYFDYQWLAGDSWATDWDQLLDRLRLVFTEPGELAAATAHSRQLAAAFHHWTDGGSAARVAEAAAQLVTDRFGPG